MSRPLLLGSLCTGYGGLDQAAADVFGARPVWFADTDPDAARVLTHHHPGVPNLDDITTVDWTRVEPVDLLTAGYPCQPVSLAGRRAGLADERWLWDDGVFPAIRDLRPRIVLLENVPGHLSVGFGRVLGDLASVGYDACWCCVRASDVGAPHRRERVFVLAWPADTESFGHGDTWPAGVGRFPATTVTGDPRSAGMSLLKTPTARDFKGSPGPASDYYSLPKTVATLLPTPRTSDTNGAGRHGDGGMDLRTAVTLLPTPRATDGTKGGPNQRGSSGDLMLPSAVQLLPTPTATPYGSDQSPSAGAAVRPSLDTLARADRWGIYVAAIARWELMSGRSAPEPVEPGRTGLRLSPRFVEWLMGLPAGWVTDVPGLTRNAQLRLLGNGVVPQQGAYALGQLLAHLEAGVAA